MMTDTTTTALLTMQEQVQDPRHTLLQAIGLGDVEGVKNYLANGGTIDFYAHEEYEGSDPAIVDFVPQWNVVPSVFSVRAQLGNDKDMSYNRAYSEFTPLSYACAMNQTEIAKVLVEHGAAVNTYLKEVTPGNENEELCSPYFPALWWTGAHYNTELALYLLKHGADVTMYYQHDRFRDGVEFFCDAGHFDMVSYFLDLDEKPYQRPYCDNDFLLLSACFQYGRSMIRLLLQNGKKPVMNYHGYTCINTFEMEYLRWNYTGTRTLDFWDMTTLEDVDWTQDLACEEEGVDALAFLVDAGASMDEIQCPVLREWVAKRREQGRCFGCRRCRE